VAEYCSATPGILGDQPRGDVGKHAGRERRRIGEPAGERDDVGGLGEGEDRGDLAAAQLMRAAREPLVSAAAPCAAIHVASIKALLTHGCGHRLRSLS
jgi:hypothetical protein